ncbi:Nucleic-acid-binding protein from transposon X-element [Araneus ventricosus]|uniref:Nucleic-acid-binding protein from transposon X-element n=1 Tax=Araneus ventricosus TaxID=182803 RepID=A0A4Y2MMS4_ARAVE|nr:Nucleic-acid-binding protein from transposon X-element [Araneus ventricosus]GBN27913.1 Nucleic-acid-binding protein from transposon X-element [Araneus ventricosus]
MATYYDFKTNSDLKTDGFTTVQKKRPRRRSDDTIEVSKKVNIPAKGPETETRNTYDVLQDQIINEDKLTPIPPPKIPPIMLKRIAEYPVLLKRINTVKKIKCTAKESGELVKLFVETPDNVRDLTKYLDELNLEYFQIDSDPIKPIKVVVKGLGINADMEEMKIELTQLGYSVHKINQFKKFRTKEPINVYQIQLLKTPNVQEIYQLTELMYMRISVEKFINKTVRQCYKCQTWRHTASNCKLKPKYVVCAGPHESKECPNKKVESDEQKIPVKCANCDGPHTASYKGCPKYPRIDKKITPGNSYTSILKGNGKQTTPSSKQPNPSPKVGHQAYNSTRAPPTRENEGQPGMFTNTPFPPIDGGLQGIMQLLTELGKMLNRINIPVLLQKISNGTPALDIIFYVIESLRGPSPSST